MITRFDNPPPENRARPFWFFNGDMNRDEVRKQILEMKNKGLGGFFLCARQGLQVPYLSEDWFSLCRYAVDLAKETGLEVWLYDEYPYPSGMSGGEVTILHPEIRQTELVFEDKTFEGKASLGLGKVKLLSAMAYPVRNGKTIWEEGKDLAAKVGILQNVQVYQRTMLANSVHNTKRYFTYAPGKELRWEESGTWRVIMAGEKVIDEFKYYGDYLDPASPLAVDTFIETTYEPYKKVLGKDFGGVIKGMFGDETGFLGEYPWSHELPGYYRKRFGADIRKSLAGILDPSYPDARLIRYRYFQCLHELLRDNYHRRLSRWCEQNHILYVTEIPSFRMSNEQYSHIPGGDPNHDKLGFPLEEAIKRDFPGFRSNSKVLSALARQFGRRDSMAESFHSIGWSMTLQDAKWQIDRETLMGISLHNFHAYYYTVDGITKHDAPPSQFVQNPYWKHYKQFADYCAHCSRYITETESSAQVAVLHPITSWWTSGINPLLRMRYSGNDPEEEKRVNRLIDDYVYLCRVFIFGAVDYDDLDAEVLALSRIENGFISAGKARYDTLVIPPVKNLEAYAWKLIEQFIASGGKVLFCGLTPYEIIEEDAEGKGIDPASFFEKSWELPGEDAYYGPAGKAEIRGKGGVRFLHAPGGLEASKAGDLIVKTVRKFSPSRTIITIPAQYSKGVVASRREDAAADYALLSSQDGVSALCVVESALPGKALVEFDLETGTAFRLEGKKTAKGGTAVELALSPWQTRLVAAMEEKAASCYPDKVKKRELQEIILPLNESLQVKIAGPNVLRLDAMDLSVDGSEYRPCQPHMFVEQARQACLIDASKHLSFDGGFGLPLRPHMKYPIRADYRFSFYVETLPGRVELMHDRMGVMGGHRITVNGKPAGAFSPRFIYDQNNLTAEIGSLIKEGENTIGVEVEIAEDWHGVSDPLYLLGDFGVFNRDGRFVIGKKPEKALPVCGVIEGFPFYSGDMTFTLNLALPKEGAFITLDKNCGLHECLGLVADSRDLGVRAFTPYRWELQPNKNRPLVSRLELTVTNTLINMLEGSYFDYEKGETTPISLSGAEEKIRPLSAPEL
ncbi:MAG: hypothetical protein LBC62_07000 [Treponema sp.]|jgi:hypothetical protein|nr:hypothetical protein [Treponema sp.]